MQSARPTASRTIVYGPHPDQVGDFQDGGNPVAPVLVLLHGGFWRMPYDRQECARIARDLQARGHTVWNVEYRRIGCDGAGWPGTADDVLAAVEHLATHEAADREIILIGHSAGGHLAIWAAMESVTRGSRVAAAVGLAPLVDLVAAHREGLGRDAVQSFLGGAPAARSNAYRAASPRERLPGGVRQLIVHGTADADVPIAASRAYLEAARAAGDDVTLVEVAGGSHMDHLDPASDAHAALVLWLESRSTPAPGPA